MAYAKIQDNKIIEYPLYAADIQLRYPNTSFTIPFVPPENYVEVLDTPPPSVDNYNYHVIEGQPIAENDSFYRKWEIIELTQEEKESKKNRLIQDIKNQREKYLRQSDWTQLPDAPVNKEAWANYRQQLRDIDQQEGFPFKFEWPKQP